MNPYTGHLVSIPATEGQFMRALAAEGYEPIPRELDGAAKKKLAGRSEATVSLTSGGKLSRWAGKKRNERKVRNRMTKESQKKNRGR